MNTALRPTSRRRLRVARLITLSLIVVHLLASCGIDQTDDDSVGWSESSLTAGSASAGSTGPAAGPTAEPTPAPESLRSTSGVRRPPTSLKERIALADVVARVRFQSVRQVVESAPSVYDADDTVYVFALEYRFRVLEYLKGAGADEVVGVTRTVLPKYSTREEAEAATEDFISTRDTRWDNREAVVFLAKTLKWTRPHSTSQPGRYTLGYLGDGRYPDDSYTISSRSKLWLPAAAATGGSAFLMDDPASLVSGEAPTITLSALKAEIAAVQAEVAAGDGTTAYRECIWRKYAWERREQSVYDANRWTPRRYEVGSGQAPSAIL